MENKSMRFLSLLLALVMVISLMPVGHVHAEEGGLIKVPAAEAATDLGLENVGDCAEFVIATGRKDRAVKTMIGNAVSGGKSGVELINDTPDAITFEDAPAAFWTITKVEGGYTISVDGTNSVQINGNNDATLAEGAVVQIRVSENGSYGTGYFEIFNSIDGTNYFLNYFDSFGGVTASGCAASVWSDNDPGSQWQIYKVIEKAPEIDIWNKAAWTKVSVDTETAHNDTEGLFEYAFDGKLNTIWHSNWKDGANDVLTGENTFAGEINFGQEHYINQFSFLPRQDDTNWANGDGVVTMASLYVKDADDTEWKLVAEHQEFEHNQDLKTFTFEAQNVQYVRFVAERSVYNGWVAVAEFYINYEEPAAHEHSYEAVVTAPTCTKDGYTTYTCECGDSYVADETAALGHTRGDMVVENDHPATCTEGGSYDAVFYCTVCGAELSRTAMTSKPNGHAVSEISGKPATCTEPGLTDGEQCCVCLEWITEQEEIPALGHSYEAVVTAPTCTTFGYTTYTCATCGYSYVADVVDALGHSYEVDVTAPTCTEGGYTTYTCTVCGDSYVVDVPALGHTTGEVVVENDVPATCTEDGSFDAVYYCTVCGAEESRETTIVKATGHYEAVVSGYPATCEETGLTDGVQCCVCHEWITEQEEIPALGHTPAEPVKENETPSDLNNEGSYDLVVYCTVCEEELSRETHTVAPLEGGAAMIDGYKYETFQEAVNAAEEGDTIVLLAPVVITEDTELDLTGKTLDGNGMYPAIRVQNNARLWIYGGNFVNETDYLFTIGAADGVTNHDLSKAGNLSIVGGNFKAMTSIVSVTYGVVSIEGGTFECVDGEYGADYMLNCVDSMYNLGAWLYVFGGTFVGFNPMNNAAEGPGTNFVFDGYCAAEENGIYTVQDHTEAEAVRENENDATCTEDGSYDLVVRCTFCGEEMSRETVIVKATGHNYEDGNCTRCGEADPDFVAVIATGWSGYTEWALTADGVLTFTSSGQTLNGETNLKNYWKVNGVLTLPWGQYADMITKVVIEDGIHDIGQMAFYELPNLQSVELGKDVTEIRNYTFKNCKNLTSINLESVDFIREGAFYGCAALENITFAEGVVVEDWAFSRTPYVEMNP